MKDVGINRCCVVLFFLFFHLSLVYGANPNRQEQSMQALGLIKNLYSSFDVISTDQSDLKVSKARLKILNDYFKNKRMDAPNEFPSMGFSTGIDGDLTVETYTTHFTDLFSTSNCNFSYDIDMTQQCIPSQPSFQKGDQSQLDYACVTVEKEYNIQGKKYHFTDHIVVRLNEMKITMWSNSTSKKQIGDVYPWYEEFNINEVRFVAALAYALDDYKKSFQLYQKIIQHDPKDADSYYRMAIMLYKKDYDLGINKKRRNEIIIEYLEKAKYYGSSDLRRWADNMLYWITC